jgi:hypothetical protein
MVAHTDDCLIAALLITDYLGERFRSRPNDIHLVLNRMDVNV